MFRRLLSPLALAALLVFAGCDSSDEPGIDTVTVTGTITNAAALGNRPVGNATLTFTEAGSVAPDGVALAGASTMVTTQADGTYTARLAPGSYSVTVERLGYAPTTRTVTVGEGTTFSDALTGTVTISGSLSNSQDGQATGLAGARVVFLFQDALTGEPVGQDADLETLAGPNGSFTFRDAPYGTFVCVVYAPGFVPAVIRDIDVPQGGVDLDLSPAVVTEQPPEGAYRIVLSWGANPDDLDSHLTGPDGQGGRFHIYFVSETFGDSNLDLDDTSSFGPETITLFPTNDGVYRYSVHNYTDQSSNGALGIAGALDDGQAARVEVYAGDALVRSYRAPTASAGDGNTWRVFEMTVDGDNVTFSGDQPGGLDYVDASGAGDLSTFIQGGWPVKGAAH